MKQKRLLWVALGVLSLGLAFLSALPVGVRQELLPSRFPAEQVVEGTYRDLEEMADYAVARRYNALQLLRDMAQDYTRQGIAVRFSGNDLRLLAKSYSMGNSIALALLPLNEVASIVVGSRGGKAHLSVTLLNPTKTSFRYLLFKIEILLERVYGIYDISDTTLTDIRGVKANAPNGEATVAAIRFAKGTEIEVQLNGGPSPNVDIAPVTKRR
ncbi:MAG: hypothetical protein NDJ90_09745 [Oligoflexia bacterium]|nr:hypothetical protein [Oligoflexia bacterium]